MRVSRLSVRVQCCFELACKLVKTIGYKYLELVAADSESSCRQREEFHSAEGTSGSDIGVVERRHSVDLPN